MPSYQLKYCCILSHKLSKLMLSKHLEGKKLKRSWAVQAPL